MTTAARTRSLLRGLPALGLALAACIASTPAAWGVPLARAFTYQGRLVFDGVPVDSGVCSIRFSVWDSEVGGTQAGVEQNHVVAPDDGYFTAVVDLGPGVFLGIPTFAGEERWLQMHVGCSGDPNGATGTTLPRQRITATPFAASLIPGADVVSGLAGESLLELRNTTAANFGSALRAVTSAAQGTAVIAESTASGSTQSWGVYATAASEQARAVYGESLRSGSGGSGPAYGGYFVANAEGDIGVFGESGWETGSGIGGLFLSNGASGVGVLGDSTNSLGNGTGVVGSSGAPAGYGGYFVNNANADLGLGGVTGVVAALDGSDSDLLLRSNRNVAVVLDDDGSDTISTFEIYDTSFSNVRFTVTQAGDVGVAGDLSVVGNQTVFGTKSAAVSTPSHGNRLVYAVESPENWFEDFGSGVLRAGAATVELETIFAETVNTGVDYHVFVTPLGDCALYVTDKTRTTFAVRALDGKACDVPFDYRIVAKRSGYETARLEPAASR